MFTNYKTIYKNKSRLPLFGETGAGFTLVETLIAIGLLIIIFSLGLFVGFDFYESYAFRSERNTIVSILQKARSQSVNNINQTRHGVHFQNPLKYVIFECKSSKPQCTSYGPDAETSKDLVIDPSYGISIDGTPFDVVFDQLGGCLSSVLNNCQTSPIIITVNANGRAYNITVNSEGQIDW